MNQFNFLEKTNRYTQYLRLSPFDTTTPTGFAQERQRKLVLTVLANFCARGVSLLASVVSIRVTVHYLSREHFGIWALITSFTAMLPFADLGIGNGLLNLISDAYGKDDRESAIRYVSSAFYLLSFIAILFAIIFVLAYPYINWSVVFNVTSAQPITEIGAAMIIFIVCFLINIPLGMVQRIRMGYQEGFINSFWLAAGSIATLFATLVFIYFKMGLPALVFALVGFPLLAQFGNGGFLFFRQSVWLLPRWDYFSFASAKHVLRVGFLFFVLSTANALGYASDGFIITQFLGVEAVAEYAIPKRLFMLVISLLSMVLAPLWPAYSEAIARKDTGWAKHTLWRSVFFSSFLGISSALILLVFSKPILKIWVGDAVSPPWILLAGFASWLILSSIINPLAMFMNGARIIGIQLIMAISMTIINVTVSIILVQRIGVAGPIWGTVISLLICVLLPTIWYTLRFVKNWKIAVRDISSN